jgi:hypothetical protein
MARKPIALQPGQQGKARNSGKAWASFLSTHLGQIRSKTPCVVQYDRTATRGCQENKTRDIGSP